VLYYKPLADFLFSWGKKFDKHLPEELLIDNREYLQGIYDGLMDSDGHYSSDGRDAFYNTSPRLIELFNVLTYILYGYLPNNSFTGKKIGGLKNCNPNNMNNTYFARSLKRPERRITKNYYVIKNIGYAELDIEVPVYDITVDCDTHSFIANNMIVHNSICLTRTNTGNGVPQLSAISEVRDAQLKMQSTSSKPLFSISDGGASTSGSIVKALVFSDLVMAGGLFAGAQECPGEIIIRDGKEYKGYAGSSTHRKEHREGVEGMVPVKGKIKDVMNTICDGVKSGFSYQGARNINELRRDPKFVRITNAGIKESGAHDVVVIK
jgi:IMP dehydrogenase/GMP reductase